MNAMWNLDPEVYSALATATVAILNAKPDADTTFDKAEAAFEVVLRELGIIAPDDVIDSIAANRSDIQSLVVVLDNKPVAIAIQVLQSGSGVTFAAVGVMSKATPLDEIMEEIEKELEAEAEGVELVDDADKKELPQAETDK